jgi:hypothetical protein
LFSLVGPEPQQNPLKIIGLENHLSLSTAGLDKKRFAILRLFRNELLVDKKYSLEPLLFIFVNEIANFLKFKLKH